MPLSGNSKITMISRLTGKMIVYVQVYQHYVTKPSPLDPYTLRDEANQGYEAQGYDAFCNSITIIGHALSNTVIPEVYASSEQFDVVPHYGQEGKKLLLFTIMALLGVILVLIGAILLASSAIYDTWFAPRKDYWNEDIKEWETWEQKISWMNEHYWYVCSKDAASFGSKITYPNVTDVPEAIVKIYQDHCANAPDITPKQPDWLWTIVYVALALGGIYVAVKVIPSLLSKRRDEQRRD
jgi:hypothetical protein